MAAHGFESHIEGVDVEAPVFFESPRPLAIRIGGITELPASYANLVHVNFDNDVLHVLFSQLTQPVITSPQDAQDLEATGYVEARCVARLILTPKMIEETLRILDASLSQFHERKELVATGASDE